jgi:hypothetical protein
LFHQTCQNLISTDLIQVDATCFINLHQVCKCQLAASLISTGLLQVDDVNKPVATCIRTSRQPIRRLQLRYGRVSIFILKKKIKMDTICGSTISNITRRDYSFPSILPSAWLITLYRSTDNAHLNFDNSFYHKKSLPHPMITFAVLTYFLQKTVHRQSFPALL